MLDKMICEGMSLGDEKTISKVFETILNELSIQVWIKDKGGKYVYANDLMKLADGIPDVDVIGHTDRELYDEYRINLFQNLDEEAMNTGVRTNSSYELADGTYEEVQKQPLFNKEGECVGIFGYAKDITTDRLLEEHTKMVAAGEARFRGIFQNAPIGIAIYDSRRGMPVVVNPKWCQVLGRSEEEIMSVHWTEFIPVGEDIAKNEPNLEELIAGKVKSFAVERRFIKTDGTIVWTNLTNATYEIDEEGTHFTICMAEDITARKRMEKEVRQLSFSDALTGIYNRNYFMQQIPLLNATLVPPFSVIMGDINGLKICNDAFGHFQGDILIRSVAEVFKGITREHPGCYAVRLGGDEFVAVLPGKTEKEAMEMAAKIRREVIAKSTRMTEYSLALGTATLTNSDTDIESVLTRAETIMYNDKLLTNKALGDIIVEKNIRLLKEDLVEKSHMKNVGEYCKRMGEALGMQFHELYDLVKAGQLHDIGMLVCNIEREETPNQPAVLVREEDNLKKHTEIGYRLLKFANTYAKLSNYVLHHHENFDGSGYPSGIAKDEIPLESRVIKLADFYDVLTNPQLGKNLTDDEAIAEIEARKGTDFDARLADLFIEKVIKNKEA